MVADFRSDCRSGQKKKANLESSIVNSAVVRLNTNILKFAARIMSKTKNVKTIGGLVNAEVLEKLRQSFNTMDILDALDVIDSIRGRVCDLEDMRKDFFLLHGQAHALINGDYSNPSGKEGYAIWELADELETDIEEWIEGLPNCLDAR